MMILGNQELIFGYGWYYFKYKNHEENMELYFQSWPEGR